MGRLGGRDGRRQVLLIAGVSRSGSTVLDFILGNRPDGFSLGEIYAWYRPFRDHHIDPQCSCGRQWRECPVWRRVGRPRARHLHRTVADALALTTVVDSSKNLTWIRDAFQWAIADEMEPHVVLSWRPPQEIAYSYWKRGEDSHTETSAHRYASKPSWLTNLEGYVRRLDQLGLGYHVVQFDQLIAAPRPTLDRLHAAIGMESSTGQERFWEGKYHSLFGSGGTRQQLEAQSGTLARPQMPPAFYEYWEGLPAAWRYSLEKLDEAVLTQPSKASSPRGMPPPWYLKSRFTAAQQEIIVRSRHAAGVLRRRSR